MDDSKKRKKQWLSPNEKTPKPSLTNRKVLLFVWLDYKGIIYYLLLKPGQTLNYDVYWAQLDRLNHNLIRKRSEIVNISRIIFQPDNARPRAA